MTIDRINTYTAYSTILGWFVGLAYFNWFATSFEHVSLWEHLLLVVAGMFVVSIVVGGGLALIMAFITKLFTGRMDGSPHAFSWGTFIAPILAFFAAKYALHFFATM